MKHIIKWEDANSVDNHLLHIITHVLSLDVKQYLKKDVQNVIQTLLYEMDYVQLIIVKKLIMLICYVKFVIMDIISKIHFVL